MKSIRAVPNTAKSAAAFLAAAITIAGCGASASSTTHSRSSTRPAAQSVLTALSAAPVGSLPAAVEDAAITPLSDGRLALLGGIDSSQNSTDAIVTLRGATASQDGTLPVPQHDAQATTLGSYAYVFGGGEIASYPHILRFDPSSGTVTQVGSLPTPASDVAVVSIGDTAYVVGGYTGVTPLDTIVAWSPGVAPRVVAHLPVGLRYAAVAVAGSRIIIAGGTEANGVSNAILSFDPATGVVSQLGHLPAPLTHASAAFIDGRMVVIGGRQDVTGGQTATILAIDPSTGAVSTVGQLPQPLSDAAVAISGGQITVAGGDSGNGPQSSILALTPKVGAASTSATGPASTTAGG